MFDPNDPRSGLASVSTLAYDPTVAAAADDLDLSDGTFASGQNFIIALFGRVPDQTLRREAEPHKYWPANRPKKDVREYISVCLCPPSHRRWCTAIRIAKRAAQVCSRTEPDVAEGNRRCLLVDDSLHV